MNKYYRHLQTAVYFFWKLIGFSWEQIYEQVLQTLINCHPCLPAYPLVAPPSRVVWTEETDKRLVAVKGAIHDFVSSSCTSGIKGQNAVIQPWGFRTGRSVDLQPDTHGWPGKHGRQLWVRCGGGDNTRAGQPHRTFILRGREPIPRCCDRHLILGLDQWNHPGTGRDVRCVRSKRSVWRTQRRGSYCYPQISQSASRCSLLEPEKPAQVAAKGANPFRKERRDRSEVMLIRPQQTHESSTNAASACRRPRHWRQRSCPSSADRKRPQPEGHGRNSILKKTRSSVICSFRICSLSWSAQGNRWWEGLRWSHRYANREQNKDERLCGDQHSSHPLGSEAKI